MSLMVSPHMGATSVAWELELELERELDAISVCSHISSSSSSSGVEETVPSLQEVVDRTNTPLQKLIDDWRTKETNRQSFQTMLNGIHAWQSGFLCKNTDKDPNSTLEPSSLSPQTNKEFQDPSITTPQQREQKSTKTYSSRIDVMDLGEATHCAASLPPKMFDGLPSSSSSSINVCTQFDTLEQPGKMISDRQRQMPDHEAVPSVSMATLSCYFQEIERGGVETTRSNEEDNDICCVSMSYEDALNRMRKKRTRLFEDFKAAGPERSYGKSQSRQKEIEVSRMKMILALESRQELEKDLRKDKVEKLALLGLHQAKQIRLFEELQRTEENYLEIKEQEMAQAATILMDLADTYKCMEEELELRRSEQDRILDSSTDQEHEYEETTSDNHRVKCCVLIQAWMRGFMCRKHFQNLKYQNANAVVSLLLPNKSEVTEVVNTQKYIICEAPKDMGTTGVSSEERNHGQEYPVCLVQEIARSDPMSGECIHGDYQLIEEVMGRLSGLAEFGSMQELKSCLDLATSLGLHTEASDVEAQLIQRMENVQTWLEQVVQGWNTERRKIQEEIQEAKRLELTSLSTVAEAIMLAEKNEINTNLEASILKASRSKYNFWMCKAKTFGLEDIMKTYSNRFHQRLRMVRSSLKREAKLGTKEGYGVLFKNANSLGLQLDVRLALKTLLKRMLQVFRRAISVECTSITDSGPGVQDWNRVEMEGAEIGLDSRTLANLRQTICEGRRLELAKHIWVTTFETNDTGGPSTILLEKRSFGTAGPICHSSECRSDEFSRLPSFSTSPISGGTLIIPASKTIWSIPQDWPEMNKLRWRWQQRGIGLQTLGHDHNSRSQHGEGHFRLKHEIFSASRVGDKRCEPATASTTTKLACSKEDVEVDHEYRQSGGLNSCKDSRDEEERIPGFSECDDDLRLDIDAHVSEILEEQQKVTPRKSTLTREMLEKKLNYSRIELRWVMKLDLTDEHLKSLGKGDLFCWCPRLRFLTVDMNKLTTLKGVFQGGEDCLEQFSARDNLMQDMVGLERLHNLKVLHLDGNLLSQLELPCSSPNSIKENGKIDRGNNMTIIGKYCYDLPSHGQLGGTPVLEFCWSRLQILTVGCNRLTNILRVGSLCPNLEVLDVGSNQLATLGGAHGNSLAGLHHLRVLDVGQNRLKGRSLWKGLESCPELVSLVASRNKLRELPNHFGSVLLREIWLNGNAIKRLACKVWLPSLQRLYLQDNMIDTLEPLWGCPALEVLDLSFNNILELSHLRHLACFPCLKSLQLNDNPISEQEDQIQCVLQAVPWLIELDNEPVAKASRGQAITRTFQRIMGMFGSEFLKEKLARGELLLHAFAIPSGAKKHSFTNTEHAESGTGQFFRAWDINDSLNGEADEASLWELLLEAKALSGSSSIMQDLLIMNADFVNFEGLRAFSEPELEARSNMIAFHQMTFSLKGKIYATTKERSVGRVSNNTNLNLQRPLQVEGSCPIVPSLNLSSEAQVSRLSDKAKGSNLEWCLEEHTTFDANTCREVYCENREYKLQVQGQIRRVARLQALLRGFLTRIRVRLLREQKMAMNHEQEDNCACIIQALWRGWKVRQSKLLDSLRGIQCCAAVTIQARWRGCSTRLRFQRAMDTAKYTDDDDFDYVSIDDSEFLAREIALETAYERTQSVLFAPDNNISTKVVNIPTVQNFQPLALILDNGIKSAEWGDHNVTNEEVRQLTTFYDFDTQYVEDDTQCAEELANLAIEVGIHANQPVGEPCLVEISQGSYQSIKEMTNLAPKDKIHFTRAVVAENAGSGLEEVLNIGLEVCQDSKKILTGENEEIEGNITHLLASRHIDDVVSEGSSFSIEEVLQRIKREAEEDSQSSSHMDDVVSEASVQEVLQRIKRDIEGDSQSLPPHEDHIMSNEREPSNMPATEEKKKATVAIEELANDWGLKNKITVQALLKARGRTKQQMKDVAQRNLLQDPELRLKRFREKVRGQAPAMGPPTRQFEQRSPFSFSGHTLQISVAEHKSFRFPEPVRDHESESSGHKLDRSIPPPLQVPRLPRQQKKKNSVTKDSAHEGKKDGNNKPVKSSTRDLSLICLPKIVLNVSLQNSPFNKL